MKDKRITVRDIAEEVGVSPMTVSRALREETNVDPQTAARIHEVANRLGYHLNPLVSNLMSTIRDPKHPLCNPIIAFLASNSSSSHPELSLSQQLYLQGARERAAERGFAVEEYVIDPENADANEISGMLYTRNIRGILIGPLWEDCTPLELDWKQYATSALSSYLVKPDTDRCGVDPVQAIRMAISNLNRLGYRRIGFGTSPFNTELNHHRSRATYLDYQYDLPAEQVVSLIQDWSLQGFEAWLANEKPDVIIGHGDEIPSWLNELGVCIPHDIGYVDIQITAGTITRFSGVAFDFKRIGAAVADLVMNNVLHNSFGLPEFPIHSYIQGYWVDGLTVIDQSKGRGPAATKNLGKSRKKAHLQTDSTSPYPLVCKGNSAQWRALDLSRTATHSYQKSKNISNWEDGLGLSLLPGRQKINGIPFNLIDEKINNGKGLVLLQHDSSLILQVNRECSAVFYLLAAGFISCHESIAEITYRWADGEAETIPLIAYFNPSLDPDRQEEWLAESCVQDWWPNYPQFNNESAKSFRLGDKNRNPVEWRYLYTLQWVNSRPGHKLKSITFGHQSTNAAKLALFAATVMEEN